MEMWLNRSTLVLLTVAAAALVISGQAPVILDKTSRTVEVPLGSSVTFHCGLKTEINKRFRVIWRMNPSGSSFNDSHELEIFKKSAGTSPVMSNKTELKILETFLKYTLSNATFQDSGWYFCEFIIEIPLLKSIASNGTQVVITKSKEKTTYPSLPIVTATVSPTANAPLFGGWMWILLGVSAFILIVLLVICVLLRSRYCKRRGEDPIYANTRRPMTKQPSPQPVVNNLKATSSSQNLRNPSPGGRYDEDKRRLRQ